MRFLGAPSVVLLSRSRVAIRMKRPALSCPTPPLYKDRPALPRNRVDTPST